MPKIKGRDRLRYARRQIDKITVTHICEIMDGIISSADNEAALVEKYTATFPNNPSIYAKDASAQRYRNNGFKRAWWIGNSFTVSRSY